FHTDPLQECGGPTPQIDDHVVDRAAHAAHQLRLSMWGYLKMEPTKSAPACRAGQVALDHIRIQALLGEFTLAERAGEEAAVVFQQLKVDHVSAGESRLREDHQANVLTSGIGTTN